MRRRSAFTLLEVLLALVISLMVLGAVYSFVGYQLKQAHAGREVIDRTTLSRSILGRIDTDIRCTIALNDPGRFRLNPDVSGDTAATAATPAAAGTSTPTTTTTGAASKSSPSTASSTTSPSSASSSTGTSSSTTSSSSSSTSGLTPLLLPLGVNGSSTELNLFISRLPGEVFGDGAAETGMVTSDLRRVSYWLGGDGSSGGLCRREVRLITSDDASADLPTGDVEQYLYAGEVKSVEFGYFDGTAWQDSWDSTTLGPDQATPLGSPRAISIKIGVLPPGATAVGGKEPELKYYRRTVQIMTANGTPLNSNPEGGTTSP